MSLTGKYGPGILGAEQFEKEQVDKVTGADKYGPGVMGPSAEAAQATVHGPGVGEPAVEHAAAPAGDEEPTPLRRRRHRAAE